MREQLFDIPKDNTLDKASAESVEFSITYQKEQHNWGTGKLEKGGFFFHVSFCTVKDDVRTSTLYGDDSFKCLVLEAKRNNRKKQEKIFEMFRTDLILNNFKYGKQEVAEEIFAQAKALLVSI